MKPPIPEMFKKELRAPVRASSSFVCGWTPAGDRVEALRRDGELDVAPSPEARELRRLRERRAYRDKHPILRSVSWDESDFIE